MNRDEKAAVIDEVAAQIQDSTAVFAVDYRGLSVTQAVELRARLGEADATFRVVKNRLTLRAADKAGAVTLKEFLEGPTAFTFVRGDAALAAKALATFRRETDLLGFKGGTMDGQALSIEQVEEIARLPGREQLQAQFVAVLASPVTGLVRGLGALLGGLALQLGQIREQGLVGGGGEGSAASEGRTTDDATPSDDTTPPDDATPPEGTDSADEDGGTAASSEAGAEGVDATTTESDASTEAESKED
jgi:large subunit ribosomal protein L10